MSSINDPLAQARQAKVGLRIASLLSAGAVHTPPDVSERLRFAREQAVARARQPHLAAAPGAVVGGSGALSMGGPPAWWQRALAVAPLLLLLAGLGLVEYWSQREQVMAAVEVDAILLADDLPPRAYSDPGFAEYLRSAPP